MQNCKVMIVDDEYWVRIMLQEVLTNSGFIVFAASNHVEAIKIVKNDKPDIAILDVNLPDMDGISLLSKIQEIKSDIKAVFISGYSDTGCVETAKARGALGFFIKPFDILEFATFLVEISTSGMASRGEGKWEMNGGVTQ